MSRLGIIFCLSLSLFGQGRIEVPFRFATPELPLVLIEIRMNNSRGLTAVLDTGQGVAPVLVNQAMARDLGLVYSESDRIAATFGIGSGPAPQVFRSKVNDLRISGVSVGSVDAGVSAALGPIGAALGQSLAANLGYGFFKNYLLSLNYQTMKLTLSKESLAKGLPFVLGPKKPLAIVDARVNGQGPYRFVVDTGASNSAISRMLAERLMMPRGVAVPVMGASGSSPAYMTKATMLEVAGRRFPEFTFATGDFLDRLGDAVGTRIDGVLGANAFRNLVLRIDYPKQRLSLENP